MNLPVDFTNYMKKLLGNEYGSFIESYDSEPFHGLRVNRLKMKADDFEQISPFSLSKIPYISNGFIYNNKDNPAKDVYYHAGLYYLQEPSAMLPANRLPICPGDRVLDLCAAPGGKATELAGKLNGSGVLYANDISASRAMALLKNLELSGAPNIYVTAEKPENLSKRLPKYFNKILCDVPCSGEGMFRKEPSLIKSWLEKGPESYQEVQRSIIESAYEMLDDGGLLMYSTCTFNVGEDEDNISWFLDRHSDLRLVDIEGYEGFSKGYNGLDKCVRVFPHKMNGEGHFLALIRKGNTDCHDLYEADNKIEVSGNNNSVECKIIKKTSKDKKTVIEYKLPALMDNGYREGIRYLRTGLMLSDSQHYAMTLDAHYENSLNLNHDDIRVIKYLKGETLFLDESECLNKGLALILVNGLALGFVKHDGQGRLKNMYNPGWRMS